MTELRALIARATPGPWHVEGDEWGGDIYGPDPEADYVAVDHEGLQPSVRSRADARLIVELRNHAAELLDAHDRMAGALAEAVDRFESIFGTVHPGEMTADEMHRIAQESYFGAEHAALAVPKEENPDV